MTDLWATSASVVSTTHTLTHADCHTLSIDSGVDKCESRRESTPPVPDTLAGPGQGVCAVGGDVIAASSLGMVNVVGEYDGLTNEDGEDSVESGLHCGDMPGDVPLGDASVTDDTAEDMRP